MLTRTDYLAALAALWDSGGFSYQAMADACQHRHRDDTEVKDVTDSTIYNWVHGKTTPTRLMEPTVRYILGRLGADEQQQELLLDTVNMLRGLKYTPDTTGPYRGLKPYEFNDAKDFCGRDDLVGTVLAEINDLFAAGGGVTLVTGVSGAGKSSLLKAGVLPKLSTDRPDDEPDRQALYLTAGPDPVLSMAQALSQRLDTPIAQTLASLRAGKAGVSEVVRRLNADRVAEDSNTQTGLVLVVDQFEQTLNAATRDVAVTEFLAVLGALITGPVPVAVLLSVRSDFLTPAMRAVRNLTARQPVVVLPMSDDALREVIQRPADNYNVQLAAGLSELLLSEISVWGGRRGHEAGVLPWMSHALLMTYEACKERRGKTMTLEDYREIGGVDGAINTTADGIYSTLSTQQRETTRRLFLRLVDSNTSGADTRQKVRLDDLERVVPGGDSDDLSYLLNRFVGARLLTIDEDTVQITHDVVMVAWAELKQWLGEDRDQRILGGDLANAADRWNSKDRRDDLLHRGGTLDDALAWCAAHAESTSALVREFVDTSQRAATRSARIRKRVIVGLSALTAVSLTLLLVTFVQNQTVGQQRDEAQSRTLASESTTMRAKDVTLSRQLALAAYRISPTVQARSALIDATAMPPAVRMLAGTGGIMNAVALHPGGAVAAMAAENTLLLADIRDHAHPHRLPTSPGQTCAEITALAYSPHGELLAAACADGTIHLWDTRNPLTPVALPTLTGLGAKVYSLAFSADGAMMAAAIAEKPVQLEPGKSTTPGSVRLWRLEGTTPQPLGGAVRVDDHSPAKSVSFRPDGTTLAVGADDGTVQLWDITDPSNPTNPVPATGVHKAVGQLAFSPDGNTLVAGGADFTVHLWSTRDPHNPTPDGDPITGADSWINAVAFSPDGKTLAIASSDQHNGLRLLDLASRQVIAALPHPAPVTSVRFSADGATVITGANDGTARLWPVASPTLAGMDYVVSATRFSPDGTRLAVGSGDLRVLDVTHPAAPRPIGTPQTNPDKFAGALAYSPDGRILAESWGASGIVQLWSTASAGPPAPIGPPLQANGLEVDALAFSPDGATLATGGRDGAVHLWDLHNPQAPAPLSTPDTLKGIVNDLAFSSDGRLLVAGDNDKTARIWDVSDPRKPTQLGLPIKAADHYVYATKFSPDGKTLAIGLADSTVHLYDVTDPAHPSPIGKPLTGTDNYIYALSFSTDGNTLAVAADDGTAWLWDVHDPASPTAQATLTLSGGALYAIGFKPHSSILAAGGSDKKAYVWTTDPAAAAALVCATTGDPVTTAEWVKYMPDRPQFALCP